MTTATHIKEHRRRCNSVAPRSSLLLLPPLRANKNNNNNSENTATTTTTSSSKPKGVYARPSAAIERGSGFFIPGLEGSRLRLVVALLLLGTCAFLSFTTDTESAENNVLTLAITTSYALLLLWQAAVDVVTESGKVTTTTSSTSINTSPNNNNKQQQKQKQRRSGGVAPLKLVTVNHEWSSSYVDTNSIKDNNNSSWQNKVEWAASSFLSMTPATTVLLLDQEHGILYQGQKQPPPLQLPPQEDNEQQQKQPLMISPSPSEDAKTNIINGVQAALDTLAQSSSGRVALSTTTDPPHPATQVLVGIGGGGGMPSSSSSLPKAIVLQRITKTSCWMVISTEQRIEAFTPYDWKWLGQFARRVAVPTG